MSECIGLGKGSRAQYQFNRFTPSVMETIELGHGAYSNSMLWLIQRVKVTGVHHFKMTSPNPISPNAGDGKSV